MRAFVVLAVVATSVPALAAMAQDNGSAKASSERRVCTRIQPRGGSHMPSRRVCLTENEWRQRLGNDWRLALRGSRPVEETEDRLGVISRPTRGTTSVPDT
jgi:hypothetical protein